MGNGERMSLVKDQQFPTQEPQHAFPHQVWAEVKKQLQNLRRTWRRSIVREFPRRGPGEQTEASGDGHGAVGSPSSPVMRVGAAAAGQKVPGSLGKTNLYLKPQRAAASPCTATLTEPDRRTDWAPGSCSTSSETRKRDCPVFFPRKRFFH